MCRKMFLLVLLLNSVLLYSQSDQPVSTSQPVQTEQPDPKAPVKPTEKTNRSELDFSDRKVSQQIPNLSIEEDDIMGKLKNTVWSTMDFPNNRELNSFFFDSKYGNVSILRGKPMVFPKQFFPMKYVQKGPYPNSSIYIIPSKEKILYYLFYLVTPYYLIISAGYNSVEPLMEMQVPQYLEDGYMMQLIY